MLMVQTQNGRKKEDRKGPEKRTWAKKINIKQSIIDTEKFKPCGSSAREQQAVMGCNKRHLSVFILHAMCVYKCC